MTNNLPKEYVDSVRAAMKNLRSPDGAPVTEVSLVDSESGQTVGSIKAKKSG